MVDVPEPVGAPASDAQADLAEFGWQLLIAACKFTVAFVVASADVRLRFAVLRRLVRLAVIGAVMFGAWKFEAWPRLSGSALVTTILLVAGVVAGRRLCPMGVTGNMGSGKSTLVKAIVSAARKDVHVIDADWIAKAVLQPGTMVYITLVQRFGAENICKKGKVGQAILRKKLAHLMFEEGHREEVESVMHAAIGVQMLRELLYWGLWRGRWLIVDAPLLSKIPALRMFCCPVWSVAVSDEAEQVRRARARDGGTEQEVRARLAVQPSLERLEAISDLVVLNDGKREELESKALRHFEQLRADRWAL